jgi:hypothetical protein
MDNATAGSHQIDGPGLYWLYIPETVTVQNFPFEKVGHCGETDVRVRANLYALARGEFGRTHVIEEDERSHHGAVTRWQ